jgi:hypothetical protein
MVFSLGAGLTGFGFVTALVGAAMRGKVFFFVALPFGAFCKGTFFFVISHRDAYHGSILLAVRKRLQKMGMKRKLPVVFSTEQADANAVILVDDEQNKKSTAGTVSYMPAVFGCYLAEYVIRKL